MKIYHAGHPRELHDCGVKKVMLSYADAPSKDFRFWFEADRGTAMFMDSGAHSVASGRIEEIRIADYIDFCLGHAHLLDGYVQLDVVGDAEATRVNLEHMENEGLKPLPVYTAAAPISELERLCERYDYIGLGGLRGREVLVSEGWRSQKLDSIFRVAARHWPVRFHAFGIVSQWVLERYPLYSADSASVKVGGAMGIMLVRKRGITTWDHWTVECARTGNAAIADPVVGNEPARMARWTSSIECMSWLEAYITDVWRQRGVAWQ